VATPSRRPPSDSARVMLCSGVLSTLLDHSFCICGVDISFLSM